MSVILSCNAGSTNIKLAAFDLLTLKRREQAIIVNNPEALTEWLSSICTLDIVAIGHRVVHGGRKLMHPMPISDELLDELRALTPLAPLHQPAAIALIEQTLRRCPAVPQLACFDTAFHHTVPEVERRLPLPRWLEEKGVLRYGFHGLSYEHVANVLPAVCGEKANGRVIVMHLGGGTSICAMRERKSVATSMGFSTLDGLMMATRCGAIDPGVILYLLKQERMSIAGIEDMLYHSSGLIGVSGISDSMLTLEQSSNPHAQEAIELFCYMALRQLGGLIALLGGVDVLVFTGGIGEHSSHVREMILEKLGWLGVKLDTARNNANQAVISTDSSAIEVRVIATDEELVIAEACKQRYLENNSPAMKFAM